MNRELVLDESANELFWIYRRNFDELEERCRKKWGEGRFLPEIKIKGERFPTDFGGTLSNFDFSMHTCNNRSFPQYLEPNNSWDSHWTDVELSDAQQSLIREGLERLEIDLNPFREAVGVAKGLWPEYLGRTRGYKNETGQLADVLSNLAVNYVEVVEQLFIHPKFKKITSTPSEFGGFAFNNEFLRISIGGSSPSKPENLRPAYRKSVIADRLFKEFVEKYYDCQHFSEVKCLICGLVFWPQSNTEWVGRVPPEFCSKCLYMGFSGSARFFRMLGIDKRQRPSDSILGLQLFTKYFGFVPNSNLKKRQLIASLYRTGVSSEEIGRALKFSSLLADALSVRESFGDWATFLNAAELLESAPRGKGGYRSIATDGHLCLSLGERAICEFLTKNGFIHEKEPSYPIHDLNPSGGMRADFRVGDVYIEFAGMLSEPAYAEKMQRKEELARALKMKWMMLDSSSLENLEKIQSFISSVQREV